MMTLFDFTQSHHPTTMQMQGSIEGSGANSLVGEMDDDVKHGTVYYL